MRWDLKSSAHALVATYGERGISSSIVDCPLLSSLCTGPCNGGAVNCRGSQLWWGWFPAWIGAATLLHRDQTHAQAWPHIRSVLLHYAHQCLIPTRYHRVPVHLYVQRFRIFLITFPHHALLQLYIYHKLQYQQNRSVFVKIDKIGLDWFLRFTENWLVIIQKIYILIFWKIKNQKNWVTDKKNRAITQKNRLIYSKFEF
jgi:hypothetical protein